MATHCPPPLGLWTPPRVSHRSTTTSLPPLDRAGGVLCFASPRGKSSPKQRNGAGGPRAAPARSRGLSTRGGCWTSNAAGHGAPGTAPASTRLWGREPAVWGRLSGVLPDIRPRCSPTWASPPPRAEPGGPAGFHAVPPSACSTQLQAGLRNNDCNRAEIRAALNLRWCETCGSGTRLGAAVMQQLHWSCCC